MYLIINCNRETGMLILIVKEILKKNWAMEKCHGICSYEHLPTFISLDNKITV